MQSAGTDWGAPFPFPNRVCGERSKGGPLTATMTVLPSLTGQGSKSMTETPCPVGGCKCIPPPSRLEPLLCRLSKPMAGRR